jgi:hypothetical protein
VAIILRARTRGAALGEESTLTSSRISQWTEPKDATRGSNDSGFDGFADDDLTALARSRAVFFTRSLLATVVFVRAAAAMSDVTDILGAKIRPAWAGEPIAKPRVIKPTAAASAKSFLDANIRVSLVPEFRRRPGALLARGIGSSGFSSSSSRGDFGFVAMRFVSWEPRQRKSASRANAIKADQSAR